MCCQFPCILPGKFILVPFHTQRQQVPSMLQPQIATKCVLAVAKISQKHWLNLDLNINSAIHKAAGLTAHGFFSHPFHSYPFPLFTCVLACPCCRMQNHKTFHVKYPFPARSSLRNGQTCRTLFSKPKFHP